ncbi:MAG TPA: PIN domain-containing protein [Chloroflexota bacterium]|nr:PIN domain-containing protein [Chloroflexota bacterium]
MSAESLVFVDTNILVYAYDVDAGKKHEIARDLLAHLWEKRQGTLSTQVLQEFYVTVTRKVPAPLDPPVARRVIAAYHSWPVQSIDVATIVEASEIGERRQLSFWDALIVTAARRAGVNYLLSEDLQDGQTVEGVRIANPFVGLPVPLE